MLCFLLNFNFGVLFLIAIHAFLCFSLHPVLGLLSTTSALMALSAPLPSHLYLQFASSCQTQQEQRGTCLTKEVSLLLTNHFFLLISALSSTKEQPFPSSTFTSCNHVSCMHSPPLAFRAPCPTRAGPL